MTRVVITGGCGFIGSHLAESLVRSGEVVTILDTGNLPPDFTGSVRLHSGDVRDKDAVAGAIGPDTEVVYHLAAIVGVDRYLNVPVDVIETNLNGTLHVLRRAAEAGAKVVLASSSEIYGRNTAMPWPEDADRVLGSTSVDRWCYATSKALAEHLAFGFARQYGTKVTIVRYFNVYGPRQRPALVVSRNVQRALRGLPPEVYDDGRQTRCFTFVDDAVAGTILAAVTPAAAGECFNLGSRHETSIADLVGLICELAGLGPAQVVRSSVRLGAGYEDIARRVPDTGKASALLGWHCGVDLQEGITRTVDWARRNAWWLDA